MIKQSTIDEVRSKASLVEVVGKYTNLKRSGSGYSGCCPFHTEKTPSFHVTPAKGIYKCFGCGKSGDVFRIVMEQERKTFFEAVEVLAAQYNVTVEVDEKSKQVTQEQKDAKKEQQLLMTWAHLQYMNLLEQLPADAEAVTYLHNRGYNEDRIKHWSLGFAPDSWDFLKTSIINMGKHEHGVNCGLVYSRDGKNFDFFRNRIIIPIHDVNGFVVGIAGRSLPSSGDKGPKYLNPCESLIYQKKKIWYGLHTAQQAIKERGFVYITEGYMDVQSMQDAGMVNTVASCGTEIDDAQVLLLKRYTEHAVLAYDGDKPGIDKAMKHVNLFTRHNMKLSLVELPDKMDPDEYVRKVLNEHGAVA